MRLPSRSAALLPLLLVAGCSMGPSADVAMGPTLNQPNPALASAPALQPPTVQAANAQAGTSGAITDVATFLDVTIVPKLSAKEKTEAASAQYNALMFGRPGAPRKWAGDTGASGEVTVGPYVRVNNIDCRDFTHTVTIGGAPYARHGTACKETDGTWSVAA
jgi:surface antigen